MKTIRDFIPASESKDGEVAAKRLSSSWHAISEGRGSRDDWEIVFADLAYESGYFSVAPAGATDAELREAEGKRKLFARIMFLLDVPMAQLASARRASLMLMQEDEIERP